MRFETLCTEQVNEEYLRFVNETNKMEIKLLRNLYLNQQICSDGINASGNLKYPLAFLS